MLEKALKKDLQNIGKTKRFKAKRPIEYWLFFFKETIFIRTSFLNRLTPAYLLYLLPIIVLVIIIFKLQKYNLIIPTIIFSFFYSIILSIVLVAVKKQAFVPVDAFQDLAKFLIANKGDIYKNLITLRLDYSTIENENNLLDPNKIGIKKRRKTEFKPYKLERYHAQFTMKDGTVCTTALNQISVRVKTTKRRSSGKVKTKIKHKHKFFYALTLKLNANNYNIIDVKQALKLCNETYNLAVTSQNNAHFVKIKCKTKPSVVASALRPQLKHSTSKITEMMDYLIDNNVIISQLKLKQA